MEKYINKPEAEVKIPIKLASWSMLVASSRQKAIYEEVMKLSNEDRITISTYEERDADWFKPYGAHNQEIEGYGKGWWDTLTPDEKSFYQAICVLKEQVLGEVVETWEEVEFYTGVTEANALSWYHSCPAHLKKQLDEKLSGLPSVREVARETDEELWDAVAYTLGDRPQVQYAEFEGEENLRSYLQYAVYQRWCYLYVQERLRQFVLKEAPRMQKERKMLSQALGLKQGGSGLPSQAEGLDTTQAATVRWLESSGETPLEYLTSVYRGDDDTIRVSDKIAAARALLDYVHRKVPTTVEVKGPSKEDTDTHASIVREVGDKLAELAALAKVKK